MDREYKRMMTAVLIALVLSILFGLIVVELTMRYFAE